MMMAYNDAEIFSFMCFDTTSDFFADYTCSTSFAGSVRLLL